MNHARRALLLGATAIFASACGGDSEEVDDAAPDDADTRGCIENFDETTDYFPDKIEATHSELWTAEYHNSYMVLSVPNSEFEDRGTLDYVLVRCGAPEPELPDDLADAQVFEVPVQRTVLNHGNGLGMMAEIPDSVDTIVGFGDNILSVSDDPWVGDLVERAEDDVNVGEGDAVDFEQTLGLEPDVVLLGGFGPGFTNVSDTVERGLPAVMISNRIESTPLASAEWFKFVSAFYGLESQANELFAEMETRYDEIATTVRNTLDGEFTAGYFCIDPNRGCEFMAGHGANTLNGHILETLGATNVFADGNDARNGMGFDYEQSLDRAADIDFFVVYDRLSVIEELLDSDPRYSEFDAFVDGRYIGFIDENYARCRFTSSVQADRLILDYALGIAPDHFEGESPDCFGPPTS